MEISSAVCRTRGAIKIGPERGKEIAESDELSHLESKIPEYADAESPTQPKTALGRRLLAIRAKKVASGEPLLSWEEIEQEVEGRRGETR